MIHKHENIKYTIILIKLMIFSDERGREKGGYYHAYFDTGFKCHECRSKKSKVENLDENRGEYWLVNVIYHLCMLYSIIII